MHVAVTRDRKGAGGVVTSRLVWEFSIRLGAVREERLVMELVAFTKLRPTKGDDRWRVVERWGSGWQTSLSWADIRVPIDVIREVEDVLIQKVKFASVAAGGTMLVVDWTTEALRAEGH